jgi:DNA-binding response OmpR family regulator
VVVGADDAIGEALVEVLRLDGYSAEQVGPVAGPRRIREGDVALVIVDLDSAASAARAVAGAARNASAVVLALASGRDATRRADDADADDWVRKPFALAEVRARVRAHLRRDVVTAQRIVVGDLEVDRVSRRVWQRSRRIEVRPKEFDLLALLLEHAGSAVSRRRIMREVWDAQAVGATKSLDVHVSSLRRKLGDRSATRIVTVRGVGYRYDPTGAVAGDGRRGVRSASPPEGAPRSTRPTPA